MNGVRQAKSERSDEELLRAYAEQGSQSAFAELVNRYAGMVYGAASRQVGEHHAAEDVAQAAFIVLARRASSLRPGVVLGAWLLGVTRLAARDWRRGDARRRKHEQAAAAQRTGQMSADARNQQRTLPAAGTPAEVPSGAYAAPAAVKSPDAVRGRATDPAPDRASNPGLDPLLDDALMSLRPASRAALVLRFFQGKSFRDVGGELGVSEQTARQRVSRGLERMRQALARRGAVMPSADGLGLALAAAVRPPPAELLAQMISAAQGAAAAGPAALAQGVISVMASTKATATAVGVLAALLLAAGLGAAAWYLYGQQTSATASATVDPTAPTLGLVPGTMQFNWQDNFVPDARIVTPSRQVNGGAAQAPPPYDGPPVSGVARTPDGRPVSGADVLLSTNEMMASITIGAAGRPQTFGAMRATTGSDGSFELRPNAEPRGLVVISDEGVGAAPLSRAAPAATVVMRPWGRIEGQVRVGSRPLAGAEVYVSTSLGAPGEVSARTRRPVTTDDAGRFFIDRVPPGRARVTYHRPAPESPAPRSISVDVQAGTTTTIAIGGAGRAVVGRLSPANDPFAARTVTLMPSLPPPPPLRDRNLPELNATPEGRAQLLEIYRSQEYLAWQDRMDQNYNAKVDADGRFRIDDVPAGEYRLTATAMARDAASGYTERTGLGSKDVTVPPTVPATSPAAPGAADSDHDAGEVQMRQYPRMMIGDEAPPLAGVDRDGKAVKLGDLRGRYVLFAITQGPGDVAWEHMLRARAIWDRFGDDPRLVMVSFYTRAWGDDLKTSIDAARMEWTHLSMGDTAEDALPPQYTGSAERLFLIDPKGRVVAKYLNAARANYALSGPTVKGKALGYGLPMIVGGLPPPAPPDWVRVVTEHVPSGAVPPGNPFRKVPAPRGDDSTADAEFTIVDGVSARSPDQYEKLRDGVVQPNADSPPNSFCFDTGTLEGRLRIDLRRVMPVAQVNTYTRHHDGRSPQVYKLFASDGSAPGFDPAPRIGSEPTRRGWTLVANVDTREENDPEGEYFGVSITGSGGGNLGRYRYLLFEMYPTQTLEAWSHSFYGEIDVVEGK